MPSASAASTNKEKDEEEDNAEGDAVGSPFAAVVNIDNAEACTGDDGGGRGDGEGMRPAAAATRHSHTWQWPSKAAAKRGVSP